MAQPEHTSDKQACYSFIDPGRMKGWVGLVGWSLADGFSHIVVLPTYLAENCPLVSVAGHRQRSWTATRAIAQRTNTRLGDRSFAAAGPRVWNSLPTQLWESDITLGQFGRALKTHLFGHWQLQRRVTVFFVRCVQIGLLTYLLNNDSIEWNVAQRI